MATPGAASGNTSEPQRLSTEQVLKAGPLLPPALSRGFQNRWGPWTLAEISSSTSGLPETKQGHLLSIT